MARWGVYLVVLLGALTGGVAIGRYSSGSGAKQTARRPLYYQDPMHPAYRSPRPGKAPDCGMELVAVYAGDGQTGAPSTSDPVSGVLHIDAEAQRQYGIHVARVEATAGQDGLRLFGRVAADETRIYRVNLGTDGYVKETHGDAVGDKVKKDQHLATVYSPEFLSVIGGYLSANERTVQPSVAMKDNSAPTPNSASAQARADRLRNLGMSDAQIQELSMSRKIPEDVYVVSPTDGFVMARDISPGFRFERHTELYSIADLSHVWILAQVSGEEARALRPGTIAQARVPDVEGSFKARVSNALAAVDPATHAVTVRLEAENPRARLRPNMYVTVEVSGQHTTLLTVPSDAVLDGGISKRVFVETSEGYFEPRAIETGMHQGDRVQITRGLSAGEMVATSGTFLIDSESKLHAALKGTEGAAVEVGVSSSVTQRAALR